MPIYFFYFNPWVSRNFRNVCFILLAIWFIRQKNFGLKALQINSQLHLFENSVEIVSPILISVKCIYHS